MEGNLDASVNDFNEGLVTFKSNLDSVLANIIEERETLRQEREQLERTRQEFEEEQFRVAQVCPSSLTPLLPDLNAVLCNPIGHSHCLPSATLQEACKTCAWLVVSAAGQETPLLGGQFPLESF